MSAVETDLWVFRDGRNSVSSAGLLDELHTSLKKLLDSPRPHIREYCLNALIRAGELESALADAESLVRSALAALTDALAFTLLSGNLSSVRRLTGSLSNLSLPQIVETSPPEGFSYYALHPLDFADAGMRLANPPRPVAVIGIRSIGTTLSAVVAATLRGTGSSVERITVRPSGHPYSRITQFTSEHIRWIEKQKEQSAMFLVVDEGPGRSGSSFLSVGEALIDAGVPAAQLTLIGSHEPDLNLLCADDAARRWKAFHFRAAASRVDSRFSDHVFVGAGRWDEAVQVRGLRTDGRGSAATFATGGPGWLRVQRYGCRRRVLLLCGRRGYANDGRRSRPNRPGTNGAILRFPRRRVRCRWGA